MFPNQKGLNICRKISQYEMQHDQESLNGYFV